MVIMNNYHFFCNNIRCSSIINRRIVLSMAKNKSNKPKSSNKKQKSQNDNEEEE
jgi:hypothetical protein